MALCGARYRCVFCCDRSGVVIWCATRRCCARMRLYVRGDERETRGLVCVEGFELQVFLFVFGCIVSWMLEAAVTDDSGLTCMYTCCLNRTSSQDNGADLRAGRDMCGNVTFRACRSPLQQTTAAFSD